MKKNRVLIGFLSSNKVESISNVTKEFIDGLKNEIEFVEYWADRVYGNAKQSKFNIANLYYFLKHLIFWISKLIVYRPYIAHYPITSYWNLEKSLFYLKIARLMGAKTVGHLHGGAFIDFWNTLNPLRKKIAMYEISKLSAFITLSDGWKEKIKNQLKIHENKLYVVTNPIEKEFERISLGVEIESPKKYILGLGINDSRKGVFDLINAIIPIHREIKYTIILAGPEREKGIYEKINYLLLENNIINVEIRVGIWGKEKLEIFHDTAFLVLPSYWENFPIVILEAAAAGIPSITTPIGATPEYFKNNESALFVSPGDVCNLTSAIRNMCANEKNRVEMGTAARAVYKKMLSREYSFKALLKVYEDIISNNWRN